MTTTYNEKEKIWYGSKTTPKYGDQHSIGSVVFEALQRNPENIAQISYTTGKEFTNREILLISIRIAQHLEKLNIQQCEIVGLCAANSDYVAPLFFAFQFRGLTVSTLDPIFDKEGIKHIYSITKPKLMFCDGSTYHNIRTAFDECGLTSTIIYTINDHLEGVPKLTDLMVETKREHEFRCIDLKEGPLQTAAILCSSGTTGLPKGVCLSHAATLNALTSVPPGPHRYLCFSTLYWMTGYFCLLVTTMLDKFTRIISQQSFNPEDFLEIVKRYNVTTFLGLPSQIGMLLASPKLQQNDLISLKMCFTSGSAIPQSFVSKLKCYVPKAIVFAGYGQTETGGSIATGIATETGNCGHVASNVEVKIFDICNQNLGPSEIGEICARTLYPWAGYYGNPEATAEIYDSERWIHSGDLGYMNNKGELYIVDRKKDVLKYNNFHFYPTEIENIILELSDVIEVCVCGIPDAIFIDLPAAAIVKAPESVLTENMVYQHVAERMVHFKHLRGGVYFFEKLPKTPSGKIVRRKVTELCKVAHDSY